VVVEGGEAAAVAENVDHGLGLCERLPSTPLISLKMTSSSHQADHCIMMTSSLHHDDVNVSPGARGCAPPATYFDGAEMST
jgi:hypothetical protein